MHITFLGMLPTIFRGDWIYLEACGVLTYILTFPDSVYALELHIFLIGGLVRWL